LIYTSHLADFLTDYVRICDHTHKHTCWKVTFCRRLFSQLKKPLSGIWYIQLSVFNLAINIDDCRYYRQLEKYALVEQQEEAEPIVD